MAEFKICRNETQENDGFIMHEYTSIYKGSRAYFAFILLMRNRYGVSTPIDNFPVLSVLYSFGNALRNNGLISDSSLTIHGINDERIDLADLANTNFGYSEESYRDIGEVFDLANERRIVVPSDGILVLAGADSSHLDDHVRTILGNEEVA